MHAGPLRAPGGTTSVDEVAAKIGEERPSLRRVAAPDGTVTMLFSDIEASTVVNERLGDVRWLELLRTFTRSCAIRFTSTAATR
jgi:class 3 adenylate cyclase